MAAAYFYSWAKIIYDANHMPVPAPYSDTGWNITANCPPREIPYTSFANKNCGQQVNDLYGGCLHCNPVAYREVPGLYRSWIINYGKQHPFGPRWAYVSYSAQRTIPWADQRPIQMPFPIQWVTVETGKERWVGPGIPAKPWLISTVPAGKALVGEAATGTTRGNDYPATAAQPSTGEIDRNRINWWALQEALVDAWYPGRAPALPVPVAPGVIPGIENPPLAPPVPGVRPFPFYGVGVPPMQISQAPAGQLPLRGPEKERKLQSSTLAGLLRIASWSWNKADDYKDYVNALYEALPPGCRGKSRSRGARRREPLAARSSREAGQRSTRRLSNRRQTGSSVQTTGRDFNGPRMGNVSPEQKIAAIAKCLDRMDGPKAIANLAKEAMEDILGAGAAKLRDTAAKNVRRKGPRTHNTQFETRAPGL